MNTSTPCNCNTATGVADLCDGALERPRYFPRQLLTPAEMTLEQQYFRDRQRRHNRLMHGWGVVCGADVCRVPEPTVPQPQPWKVRVASGYVLGPYGDEIVIDRDQVVDLRTLGVLASSGSTDEPADVWCAPVFLERNDRTLYVAVRYKEILSRPVRVQPAGCGCDDAQCEYSRLRDGYEIGILTECPESHKNPPDLEKPFQGPVPACPTCPDGPWVVLAKVDLDPDGRIRLIDNCSCRRIVLSASDLWWRCTQPLDVVSIDPDESTGESVHESVRPLEAAPKPPRGKSRARGK